MAERRFIDANNLIEEIREERCYNCRNFKDMKCDYCRTADYIYMIEDMPAADVAPVIHARWERRGSSWYCTHCGIGYRITCGNIPASRHKYCPNCGAKMDEKENDNATY